jgi:hypothetical protein
MSGGEQQCQQGGPKGLFEPEESSKMVSQPGSPPLEQELPKVAKFEAGPRATVQEKDGEMLISSAIISIEVCDD